MRGVLTKIAQILVAAGKGARSGSAIPKQYVKIGGKPVLAHTVEACLRDKRIGTTGIVVAKGDPHIEELILPYAGDIMIVTGGTTRTASVQAGLEALKAEAPDHVLIHDGARPFVSDAVIDGVITALADADAAVPSLPVTDAIKTISCDDVDRNGFRRMQTPQGFHYDKIAAAFSELEPDAQYPDDIAIARKSGLKIQMTEGSERNFKVTFPEDFERAEAMLAFTGYMATGSGFDVHRFTDGDILWLCGVPIECGYTLLGHSDADAGLHALTDALLGAIADGDIGDHFPPSDPQWKGASSDEFLEYAVTKITDRGGQIQHVDITLICEKPKIKPHRDAMRARLSEILKVSEARISVKATTTEGLGFTGRGEGLAAQASATVKLPS